MTHCHREFFHAQWKEILDDEFLEAYEHGVVIECCDGKSRRFYLRIFAYTADYPEKYVYVNFFFFQKIVANKVIVEFFLVAFETWVTTHVPDVLFQKSGPICLAPDVIEISEKVLPEWIICNIDPRFQVLAK